MKKILLAILALGICIQVNASTPQTTSTVWTETNGLERVKRVGQNILIKNNLPTQVTFTVQQTDDINAFASGENQICVYTGLLNYVSDDAELAAVISHEIGHIINNHIAKQSITSVILSALTSSSKLSTNAQTGLNIANNLGLLKMSRTQEYEADVTGADLIAKAGYNPLAMVSLLYKISDNAVIDITSTHPAGDKRTMYSYDYITYNYPSKLKESYNTDSYKQFLKYATPIVENRNASASKLMKFNKEQAKLQEKRQKKLEKYQKSSNNAWTRSYTLLQNFVTTQGQE